MANNHVYGFRFKRSISGGGDCPQILTYPIASTYAPNTADGGGGTPVNLNIGDPVRLRADGTLRLTSVGTDVTGEQNSDPEKVFGVVVGFPRVIVGGAVRPGSFYTATTYSGGIGSDSAPLCAIIPAAGNIFEVDLAAVVGTGLKSDYLALIGTTASITYTPLTSGIGQPKANPLLGAALASTVQAQCYVVGLGKVGDAMDFTSVGVTMQVMFSAQQLSLVSEVGQFGAANA